MMTIIRLFGLMILCTVGLATAGEKEHDVHWGYTGKGGPEHWSHLKAEFEKCGGGRAQSPIDISAFKEMRMGKLTLNYRESKLRLINNGHTIQANIDAGSAMKAGDREYQLLQFHFHSPSEHTLHGKAFPMEAHLVHRSGDGTLAVVGVFFEVGSENGFLQTICSNLPDDVGHEHAIKGVSIRADRILPEDRSFFKYPGSLTTPPCSEGVRWHVMETPVEASKSQIDKLAKRISPNARPVQPLNDRVVLKNPKR